MAVLDVVDPLVHHPHRKGEEAGRDHEGEGDGSPVLRQGLDEQDEKEKEGKGRNPPETEGELGGIKNGRGYFPDEGDVKIEEADDREEKAGIEAPVLGQVEERLLQALSILPGLEGQDEKEGVGEEIEGEGEVNLDSGPRRRRKARRG